MSEEDLINKIAYAVAKQVTPTIPFEIDLWDVQTIAIYLKRSDAYVRQEIVCLPSFPKSIKLPSKRSDKSQKLFKASEVITWVEKRMA